MTFFTKNEHLRHSLNDHIPRFKGFALLHLFFLIIIGLKNVKKYGLLLKTLVTSFNNRYLYSFFGVIATSDEMKGDNALQSQKNDIEKKQVLHCTRKKESTKM